MRRLIFIYCCFCFLSGTAQEIEKEAVQRTIETFFEGFHQQDSTMLKDKVAPNVIMQTIGDKEGLTAVKQVDFNAFVSSILKIADSVEFQEKILSYHIQIDGPMAHVWTPYEFWYQGNLSHCGTNSFQLLRSDGQWKIIYIVDTRRKEGCD
ncbi:MAG: nuclear transport factor 2 family protein [Sediminicola sp.]|tara:strand:+ start:96834 stop:97286 length:453 start_codon:yes stop_codon:yes gene_type:complete